MEQGLKDPALSLEQFKPLLWCGFNPWPGNSHMPEGVTKKKKIKTEGKLSDKRFRERARKREREREGRGEREREMKTEKGKGVGRRKHLSK